MKIKSNTLVMIGAPLVLILTILFGLKQCGSGSNNAAGNNAHTVADVTPDELKALGIEGDTAEDTLRTVIGRMKVIQSKQEGLEKANQVLAEENNRLQQLSKNIDKRISNALRQYESENTQAQQQLENQHKGLLQQIESTLDNLKSQSSHVNSTLSDIPIGLGLENTSSAQNEFVWIEPQDAMSIDRHGNAVIARNSGNFRFPSSFMDDNLITRQKAELDRNTKNQRALSHGDENNQPVYTLPENSTLVGSQAMTALLGRVPIEGKVTDPYPFKILIGKDNLTANGIELPEVEGAVVSGTATGDWTLSCVRGDVNSITFVFTDGTVRTVPAPSNTSDGSGGKNNGGTIGWISDTNGIPCLSGERKSNASTYLPTLFALSAVQAAGDAVAQNQTTTTVDGGTITNTFTGSQGQSVLGKSLSGGMKEANEWVKARFGQTFDAIYVPPGTQVAVHITRQIPIDYEEQGRKVRHDFSLGINHQTELD